MEVFKPIKNYEGLYEISDKGNVRALPRYNVDKNGKSKFYPEKLLKFDITVKPHTSYARVTLSKEGVTTRYLVHRLVALHFLPLVENKDQVNHIDNNGLNNDCSNLEWVTGSENMQHSQKQGRQYKSQSAGGTVSGTNKRLALINKLKSLVNTTIKNFKILDYLGFSNLRHRLLVTCTRCNTTTTIESQYLLSSKNFSRCTCCRNVKDENLSQWLKDNNKI